MSLDSSLLAQLRERLAGQPADPRPGPRWRSTRSPRDHPEAPSHQTLRLCDQVARCLDLCLSAAGDPCLNELTVVSVEPLSGAARLRVLVTSLGDEPLEGDIEAALDRAQRWLRHQVAQDIHRKRAPSLVLVYVSGVGKGP